MPVCSVLSQSGCPSSVVIYFRNEIIDDYVMKWQRSSDCCKKQEIGPVGVHVSVATYNSMS